jgi:hypothetical protein
MLTADRPAPELMMKIAGEQRQRVLHLLAALVRLGRSEEIPFAAQRALALMGAGDRERLARGRFRRVRSLLLHRTRGPRAPPLALQGHDWSGQVELLGVCSLQGSP